MQRKNTMATNEAKTKNDEITIPATAPLGTVEEAVAGGVLNGEKGSPPLLKGVAAAADVELVEDEDVGVEDVEGDVASVDEVELSMTVVVVIPVDWDPELFAEMPLAMPPLVNVGIAVGGPDDTKIVITPCPPTPAKKASFNRSSPLNSAAPRSLEGHLPDPHGLLLQQPMNGGAPGVCAFVQV